MLTVVFALATSTLDSITLTVCYSTSVLTTVRHSVYKIFLPSDMNTVMSSVLGRLLVTDELVNKELEEDLELVVLKSFMESLIKY